MSGFNLISEVNLPQMDRHQNDIHRNPVINQDQNAHIAKNEAQQKLSKPVEPEKMDKKSIDPKQKREEKRKNKREKLGVNTGINKKDSEKKAFNWKVVGAA
ncbi:MAG: hypothetical protein Q4F84_04900, partial [Fibrobacter sp.]|nr:hypothetical protein [Fibrobacter sp.]